MPETTARLQLPIIAPSQAQKHITHNEALLILDGVTQLVVESIAADVPPVQPSDGGIYALGATPSGAWSGQAGTLAQWQGSGWYFLSPQSGWRAWDRATSQMYVFDGADWNVALQNLDGLGIGTTSDATNRLAVASPASLLTHAGAGHQVKLNKAASGDTASLMFQTSWLGHAELGLTGDNDFHLKVSMDGSSWTEAFVFDASTGHVRGAAVQSSAEDMTPGRLMRVDYGYGPGNLVGEVSQSNGTPTGAVLEQGGNANGNYVRFADGTQICTAVATVDIAQASAGIYWSEAQARDFPMPFSGVPTGSGSLASTAEGWVNGRATSATSWDFSAFSPVQRTGETVQLVAIGRWV